MAEELDRNAIVARLEVVAESLELPAENWQALAKDEKKLLLLVRLHGVSSDWLIFGDVRPCIREGARARRG